MLNLVPRFGARQTGFPQADFADYKEASATSCGSRICSMFRSAIGRTGLCSRW